MKINIIKDHHHYSLGQHDVSEERANYLIRIGVAEEISGVFPEKEIKDHAPEKVEFKPGKEKVKRGRKKNK